MLSKCRRQAFLRCPRSRVLQVLVCPCPKWKYNISFAGFSRCFQRAFEKWRKPINIRLLTVHLYNCIPMYTPFRWPGFVLYESLMVKILFVFFGRMWSQKLLKFSDTPWGEQSFKDIGPGRIRKDTNLGPRHFVNKLKLSFKWWQRTIETIFVNHLETWLAQNWPNLTIRWC